MMMMTVMMMMMLMMVKVMMMMMKMMKNLRRCFDLNSNVRKFESVEWSWRRLVVHLNIFSKLNI